MLTTKPALLLTFSSTTQAIEVEGFCLDAGLPGRLIPVPQVISAACGLAWKAPTETQRPLTTQLAEAGLDYAALYVLEL